MLIPIVQSNLCAGESPRYRDQTYSENFADEKLDPLMHCYEVGDVRISDGEASDVPSSKSWGLLKTWWWQEEKGERWTVEGKI